MENFASMIPILVLLLTLVKYTPLTEGVVIRAVAATFPSTFNAMIVSIVTQVYNRSASFIPVMLIVALWSAGKGVLSITCGLNRIYDCEETRNYLVLRLRASFYTLVFLVAIVLSLILAVFGNSLSLFLVGRFPFMAQVLALILSVRTLGIFLVLTVCWVLIYRYLPNRKAKLYLCMYIVLLGGEVNVLIPVIWKNIRELFFAKSADIEKLSK